LVGFQTQGVFGGATFATILNDVMADAFFLLMG
jgi:hypothetical protein